MLPEWFDFQVRTKIVAGPGVASGFGNELARFGASRAFVVTDKVIRDLGFVERVGRSLEEAGLELVGVFDDVPPNSEFGVVRRGAEACRDSGGDLLVAVGGGSVLDTAKGMNLMLSLGGDIADYLGFGLIEEPLGPSVAVPTTAGTGSEVTAYAVIRQDDWEAKQSFVSPYLAFDLAVLDPELTFSLPPKLTASTGLDALTHAVEAYLSTNWRPFSDALAIHACRTIVTWLPRAVEAGEDLEARYEMLTASCEAGMAFSLAMVGCVHAMAHAAGGLYEVPHGLANAILLPHGMDYNRPAAEARLADLARTFGVPVTGDADADARAAVEFVRELVARVGLPTRLREAGVPEDGLEALAEAACVDAAIYTNPREATPEEILEVLKKAH